MKDKSWKNMNAGAGTGGAVYGLGVIGAIIYFLQNATTIGQGALGIVKAILWPAFLVFKIFEFLKL